MSMRRNRGALVGFRQDDDSSEDSEPGMEIASYRSEDEGFKEVKRRDMKKRKQERQLRKLAKKGRISTNQSSTSTKIPESPTLPDQHESEDKQQINTETDTTTRMSTQTNPDEDITTRMMTQTNPDEDITTRMTTQTNPDEDNNPNDDTD